MSTPYQKEEGLAEALLRTACLLQGLAGHLLAFGLGLLDDLFGLGLRNP